MVSAALAISVPFLPVVERTATISWPDQQGVSAVTTPLTSFQPEQLRATVPCSLAQGPGADAGRMLFATAPDSSPRGAAAGMSLRASGGQVSLSSAGRELARAPVPGADCAIEVVSDAARTVLNVGGALTTVAEDVRPQVVGVYTDLPSITPTDG